jgi:hypothetical protein
MVRMVFGTGANRFGLFCLSRALGTYTTTSMKVKAVTAQKLTYWRRGFDWRREPNPELIVIAKRLDREAPPVAAPLASAVFVNTDEPAMMAGIDIPTIGC